MQGYHLAAGSSARYCKHCRRAKPPMAHHCHICQRCVLRMDHHCPWYPLFSLHACANLPTSLGGAFVTVVAATRVCAQGQ